MSGICQVVASHLLESRQGAVMQSSEICQENVNELSVSQKAVVICIGCWGFTPQPTEVDEYKKIF